MFFETFLSMTFCNSGHSLYNTDNCPDGEDTSDGSDDSDGDDDTYKVVGKEELPRPSSSVAGLPVLTNKLLTPLPYIPPSSDLLHFAGSYQKLKVVTGDYCFQFHHYLLQRLSFLANPKQLGRGMGRP